MSQKINYHINKQELNHRGRFLSFNCKLEPSAFNEADDILSSSKSSLETLLVLIKNCQLDYISNKSSKKSYLSNTKQILSFLKDNLKSNLNEKNKTYDFLKNKNEIKKKELQEKIFSESVSTTDMGSDVTKIHSEKNQLKLLNFQIENEIKNTDFLISQKSNLTYNKENKEVFCNYINGDILKVSNILNENLNDNQNKFIDTKKEKIDKKNEIKSLTEQISHLKEKIKELKEIKEKEKINKDAISAKRIDISTKGTDNVYTKCEKNIEEKTNKSEKIIIDNKWKKRLIEKNILKGEKFQRKNRVNSKTINQKMINNINNVIKNYLNKKKIVNNKQISKKDININKNNDKKSKRLVEYSLHSFNSSIDSNSLSCGHNNRMLIQEIELMEKKNKLIYPPFNLSDDGSNTDNSNNSSNRSGSKHKYNENNSALNEKEKTGDEEEYIFAIMSDNDLN